MLLRVFICIAIVNAVSVMLAVAALYPVMAEIWAAATARKIKAASNRYRRRFIP